MSQWVIKFNHLYIHEYWFGSHDCESESVAEMMKFKLPTNILAWSQFCEGLFHNHSKSAKHWDNYGSHYMSREWDLRIWRVVSTFSWNWMHLLCLSDMLVYFIPSENQIWLDRIDSKKIKEKMSKIKLNSLMSKMCLQSLQTYTCTIWLGKLGIFSKFLDAYAHDNIYIHTHIYMWLFGWLLAFFFPLYIHHQHHQHPVLLPFLVLSSASWSPSKFCFLIILLKRYIFLATR